MIFVFYINLTIVLFAFISRYKYLRYSLKISFTILLVFLAIRHNFGNDYKAYFESFNYINSFKTIDIFDKSLHYEPGWILLYRFFKPIGFYSLVAILSLLYCITFYYLIQNYSYRKWYWLSVFILIFSPNLLLIPASAMRQSLACTIFVMSLKFVFNKNLVIYLLLILLASTFHSSVLVLIPIYFIYNFTYNSKTLNCLLVSLYILITITGNILFPHINIFVETVFKTYSEQYQVEVNNEGLNILSSFIRLIPFTASVIIRDRCHNRYNLFFINLFIISQLTIQLSFFMPIINRFEIYLGISTIIVIPIICNFFWRNFFGRLFVILYLIYMFRGFVNFFSQEVWEKAYGTYHTIFEVL